jgi:hypothetical protein
MSLTAGLLSALPIPRRSALPTRSSAICRDAPVVRLLAALEMRGVSLSALVENDIRLLTGEKII